MVFEISPTFFDDPVFVSLYLSEYIITTAVAFFNVMYTHPFWKSKSQLLHRDILKNFFLTPKEVLFYN